MKVVFMGTPEFAVPVLDRLIDSRHEVVLTVTQPDRPKGRGQKLEASPVKLLAEQHSIPVIQPKSLKREPEAVEAIRAAGADIGVVAAFGQILPREVLDAPRLGCINVHPSLLPEYRGAAPIQRCILEGASDTGVTLIMLTEELDAGPIVAQQRLEILSDDDARSIGGMLAAMGAEMLLRVLDEAEQTGGQIEAIEQDEALATYAPQITKEEGLIPWDDSTDRIMYRLRAMTPWPGAFTYIDGERQLIITQAEPLWENEVEELGALNEAPPGLVTSIKKGFGFTVKTGDGQLLVTGVQPTGKRPMDAMAFVIGRNIDVGNQLGPKRE